MNYDLLVIGSGEGGKYLAWNMARHGWKVALVERKLIGGSCPNVACLPSKNVIYSAKMASLFSRGSEFGLQGSPLADMERVFHRKQEMVDSLRELNRSNFIRYGVDLIFGTARLLSQDRVAIRLNEGGDSVISAA